MNNSTIDFFDLTPQQRVLFALVILGNFREPKEIADCLNKMVDYFGRVDCFGRDRGKGFIESQKRETTTVSNMLRVMSKARSSGPKKGFLVEMNKRGRKFVYSNGENTIATRTSALIVVFLWKAYHAHNETLAVEQAVRIVEDHRELTIGDDENNLNKQDLGWFAAEIAKERLDRNALKAKFEFTVRTGYFQYDNKSDLLSPTKLYLTEETYIHALVNLLPAFNNYQQLNNEVIQKNVEANSFEKDARILEASAEDNADEEKEIEEKNPDGIEVTSTSVQEFRQLASIGAFSGNRRKIEIWFAPKTAKDLKGFGDSLLNEIIPEFYNGFLILNIVLTHFNDVIDLKRRISEASETFINNGSAICLFGFSAATGAVETEPEFKFKGNVMIFVRAYNR